MKFGHAFYVAEPNPEIYIFTDEDAVKGGRPEGLPESAVEICAETNVDTFLDLLEPYFVLAKDG